MRQNKFLAVVIESVAIIAVTWILASSATAASQFKILHTFTWASTPDGKLVLDAAGNLYGTTVLGAGTGCGIGCGAVYKLSRNPDGTWRVSIIHVFTGPDGGGPIAGLTFDAAGNLFGTTTGGGGTGCGGLGCGAVYKLSPKLDGTWTESVLYSFTGGTDGGIPYAKVILDSAGNLYGTTFAGGDDTVCTAGCGVVFKLAQSPDGTWTETVLHSFTGGADGGGPVSELIFDSAGNLCGTTPYDGVGFGGVVFRLAPNPDGTWTESVLHSFTGPDGSRPEAALMFDAAGNLYGTASEDGGTTGCGGYGCGVVFKLAPNLDGTWTESVLHRFTGGADGSTPLAGLASDAAGSLYGTASRGGAGYGVVFKLVSTASGWSETVLHAFWGVGRYPDTAVIFDPAYNLYGTTSAGTSNQGLVFEITP